MGFIEGCSGGSRVVRVCAGLHILLLTIELGMKWIMKNCFHNFTQLSIREMKISQNSD